MNKLLPLAAAIGLFSANASALTVGDTFGLDVDGAGGEYLKVATNLLQMTQLNTQNYVYQDLGADGVLSNGDVFTEYGRYRIDRAQFEDFFSKTDLTTYDATDFWMDVELGGAISNVNYGGNGTGGVGVAGDGNGNNVNDLAENDTFGITFTSGTLKLYYESDDDPASAAGRVNLFNLSLKSGSIDEFKVANATPTGAVGLTFELDEVLQPDVLFLCDPKTTDNPANCTVDLNTVNLSLLVNSETIDSSVNAGRLLGLKNGANPAVVPTGFGNPYAGKGTDQFLFLLSDNGATFRMEVPEPGTLALLGIGLLGFAGYGRKTQKSWTV